MNGYWEPNVSIIIRKLLELVDSSKQKRPTVFLDVGANLGIHGLYAANLGYRVWSVEPQQQNIVKIHRSAKNRDFLVE